MLECKQVNHYMISPQKDNFSLSCSSLYVKNSTREVSKRNIARMELEELKLVSIHFQEGHRSSSGGYAESPPDLRGWTEEERRRRRKTFTLDFLGNAAGVERGAELYGENVEVSPTPSHRHRPRGKSTSARSPHKNNRKRETVQQTVQVQQSQQQQLTRSPQKEDWRVEQAEDGGHVPTSDDSSCSHYYHMHHHHHHHMHREGADGRHRRTRESPRRKTTGYVSARRRSNEVSDIVEELQFRKG